MEQFWKRVDKGDPDECWEWTGPLDRGYGQFNLDGGREYAHRTAVKLDGRDPDGYYVCHKCDNRKCVNPSHLYLGDHADNLADAAERDIIRYGEEHPDAKLSDAEVARLYRRYDGGDVTQAELAEVYGVSRSCVSAITTGRNRGRVTREL